MKRITSENEIEHSLCVMLYNYDGHRIELHERCDITREKENIFFPIREVFANEGVVICRCRKDDLNVSTSAKPVWCEFTIKEKMKVYETVKQEYYQRKYGDCAYQMDAMGRFMRKAIRNMGKPGEKFKFTESEAPRFYHDGGWREVIELQFPKDKSMAIIAGWHDERCLSKGVNARISLSCLPMECQRDFFILMARRKAASYI